MSDSKQAALQSEFQDSLGYTEKPSLEQTNGAGGGGEKEGRTRGGRVERRREEREER